MTPRSPRSSDRDRPPDGRDADARATRGAALLADGRVGTFDAMEPAPELRWADARRLFEARVGWPLGATDVAVVARLTDQGYAPSPEAWRALVGAVGARVGWPTTAGRLEVLGGLVREAGGLPAWMLHDLYGAARQALAELGERLAGGEARRACHAASDLITAVVGHANVGAATLSRFGHDVAEGAEADGPGPHYALGGPGERAKGVCAVPAFVRAMMSGGGCAIPWRVMARGPGPWPRRALRRLARTRPEAVARALEGVGEGGGKRSAILARLLDGPLVAADLEGLLRSEDEKVRAAGLVAMGRLEGAGAARDPAAGPERPAEEELAAALAAGALERYDALVEAGGAIGDEAARALYRELTEEGPIDDDDRRAVIRLLRAGHEPTRAQWDRVLEPAHSAGERRLDLHYAEVWYIVHEADPPAWMRLAAYEMARTPPEALRPEGWNGVAEARFHFTLIAELARRSAPGGVLRARFGRDLGRGHRSGEAVASAVRWAYDELGDREELAGLLADETFVCALLSGGTGQRVWPVMARGSDRWARAAFVALVEHWPDLMAEYLLEPAEGPDNEVVARALGLLTRVDLKPLLESREARHRQAGLWALGRLGGRAPDTTVPDARADRARAGAGR